MKNDWVLPGIVIILFSVVIVLIAIKRPRWFIENYRYQRVLKLFGARGATAFYIILGLLTLMFGIFLLVNGLVK